MHVTFPYMPSHHLASANFFSNYLLIFGLRAPSAPAKPEAKPDAKKGEKEKAVEEKLTPQERLKMKMRMALNKTSMISTHKIYF